MSTAGDEITYRLHDERRTRGRAPRAAQNPQKETRSSSLGTDAATPTLVDLAWSTLRAFTPAKLPNSRTSVGVRSKSLERAWVPRPAGFCGFCVRLRLLRSAVLALRDVYDRVSQDHRPGLSNVADDFVFCCSTSSFTQ